MIDDVLTEAPRSGITAQERAEWCARQIKRWWRERWGIEVHVEYDGFRRLSSDIKIRGIEIARDDSPKILRKRSGS